MLILKMQLNQYVCADAPNPPKVATAPCSISNTLTKSRYVETANRLPAIHLARKSFFLPSAEDKVSSFIPLGLSFAYTQESAKAYTTKNNGYSISYQFMKFEIQHFNLRLCKFHRTDILIFIHELLFYRFSIFLIKILL